MKIVDAQVVVTNPGRNFVTLKITTDEGVTGLGRVSLVTGRAASPCLLAQVPDSHSVVVGAQ
jgi:L-alanine-DL-glutamate epimerase-like enolase superfamily enzyme